MVVQEWNCQNFHLSESANIKKISLDLTDQKKRRNLKKGPRSFLSNDYGIGHLWNFPSLTW